LLPVSIDDLRNVIALSDLPEDHLRWLLDHAEYRAFNDGDLVGKYGEPADVMWILLEGKVPFYMYMNGRQVYYFTFENNHVTGGIGGIMPYSRLKTYPGYSYALGHVRLLSLHKKHFAALEKLNPDFIQKLIGYMTERARIFATTQLQHEKVNALGTLAAGIAHEMNNPAAAIREIADELNKRLENNYVLTKELLACHITLDQLHRIHILVVEKESRPPDKRAAMKRMQDEDELAEWLKKKGVRKKEFAETFSEYGLSSGELEGIWLDLGADAFTGVAPWLENLISSKKIINDLAEASSRISRLVTAIKSHVHMDKAKELQLTDIHNNIENTLTLLGFKLREKNIEVRKEFSTDIPNIPAFVSELNQVWTNLIDNAIYALEKNGTLTISTTRDEHSLYVSIIDNGRGIPPANLSRIFEPFFTTKNVGEGAGIGLDIVSRIIRNHNGTIKVESEAGRTSFTVCLPIIQHMTPKI
jgi:signal transduction histidine kinase